MFSPSVTGVEVAGLLTACTCSTSLAGIVCRQAIFPSFRFTAITSGLLAPASKPVMKMRSPQIQGDPWPRGKSIFQSKAFVGPNSAGSDTLSFPSPKPLGPRNCGHLSSTGSALRATTVHNRPHSKDLVIIRFTLVSWNAYVSVLAQDNSVLREPTVTVSVQHERPERIASRGY